MKKILLLLLAAFALSCCSDDDHNKTLPPATQTGAGTFACYVNGKPFIDKSGGWFNCYYQLVDGEYYFAIGGNDSNITPHFIILGTTAKSITQGEILQLFENQNGNAWGGGGFLLNINSSQFSNTNQINTGELTITKLDFENHIVSGTFWFDIENPYTGELVQIRDGRFDTLFTE